MAASAPASPFGVRAAERAAFADAVFTGAGLACERGGRRVFHGLSFTVAAGEALVLVGRNGCGKSSLLRLMAGLGRPAEGLLAWSGVAIADDSEAHHRRLHLIGHQDAIKPALTVKENLGFWARYQGGGRGATARIDDALRAFALDRLAELPARYLSQGQRRRLGLCRLLASQAQLWLLDEPRAGLDRAANESLDAVLARHRAAGGIAVVVLHAEDHPPAARVLDFDAAVASA
ncbi:MAG: heme ABC exporter ATP-binding protein CcmA [Defluviicoccus sp.]